MPNTTQPDTAAWVPDDVDETEAADLALAWFEELGYRQGPLLVCNAVSGQANLPRALYGLPTISPQSRDRHQLGRDRPVLALRPFFDTLELASTRAHRGALCVLAGYAEDVAPWVVRTSAQNLAELGSEPRLPELAEEVQHALDSLLFFGGKNGFVGAGEKEHTIRSLRAMVHAEHRPTPDAVAAYARASGKDPRAGGHRRLPVLPS